MIVNDITHTDQILASAYRTLDIEAQAIIQLKANLDNQFTEAVKILLACQGRVVVSGIGKTGHIARKMASTLASTGTPAFFLHAAEAIHGDLGMLRPQDVLIAISYSGHGQELLTILPPARRMGTKIIALTGNPCSDLASQAHVQLDISVSQEACPLNLAPTASTTVALALGDALAVACLEARGFSSEDFARSHPGGALGRRLLTHVSDVMRRGTALPIVFKDDLLQSVLEVMSKKGMGLAIVLDSEGLPIGLFTDGDLRRLIEKHGDIRHFTILQSMRAAPRTINMHALATEAVQKMDEEKLNHMLVVDNKGKLVGALHMHDLMAAKVI